VVEKIEAQDGKTCKMARNCHNSSLPYLTSKCQLLRQTSKLLADETWAEGRRRSGK